MQKTSRDDVRMCMGIKRMNEPDDLESHRMKSVIASQCRIDKKKENQYRFDGDGFGESNDNEIETLNLIKSSTSSSDIPIDNEVRLGMEDPLKFPTPCPSCHNEDAETIMRFVEIPLFKEVIIMSLHCSCGYISNEVKPSGSISKYATKIALQIQNGEDLLREVLKSDSAGVEIPDLELELGEGGLGGLYTTVEGLLTTMFERLSQAKPFWSSDNENNALELNETSPNVRVLRFDEVLLKLRDMKEGKTFPFTLIIQDPLSNSFVGPTPKAVIELATQPKHENHQRYPKYIDPGIKIHEYERSSNQNEVLGLNDIKTETNEKGEYTNCITIESTYDINERAELQSQRTGKDHPHASAKGTSLFDDTVMGGKM